MIIENFDKWLLRGFVGIIDIYKKRASSGNLPVDKYKKIFSELEVNSNISVPPTLGEIDIWIVSGFLGLQSLLFERMSINIPIEIPYHKIRLEEIRSMISKHNWSC